jgi:hypothetical protein
VSISLIRHDGMRGHVRAVADFASGGTTDSRDDVKRKASVEMAPPLPRRVGRLGFGCVLAAAILATPPVSSARSPVGCGKAAGKKLAVSRHYVFTLRVGPAENMFMPYQVRASHPKHGEEMLRGQMTTDVSLLSGGPVRHVEVQICTRGTRAVVTNASPKIVVHDLTKGRVVSLPVAVMEGIGKGVADLHYGNNVAIPRRHRFVITVTWKNDRGTFAYVSS